MFDVEEDEVKNVDSDGAGDGNGDSDGDDAGANEESRGSST